VIDVAGITHIHSGVVTCHEQHFDYRYESYGWQARQA
jgi:hypothetical protein